MSATPELPKAITDASENGELVLFIGAGLSCAAGLTDWRSLKEELISNLKVQSGEDEETIKNTLRAGDNYYKCFEQIREKDPIGYRRIMKKGLFPDEETRANFKNLFEHLKKLKPISIVTLNVDCLLPDNNPYKNVHHDVREEGDCWPWEISEGKIFCFHGLIDRRGGETNGWVFTTEELTKRYQMRDVGRFLHGLFSGFYKVLFIGFSFSDEQLLEYAYIPADVRQDIEAGDHIPFHYALLPSNDLRAIGRAKSLGIQPLTYAYKDEEPHHDNFNRTLEAWSTSLSDINQDALTKKSEIPPGGPEANV